MSLRSPENMTACDSGARFLPASERSRVAWKNRLGMTMEVAVSPAGANYNDFDWRVSIAELTSDAAFSAYPGVDRIVTLLSPDAISLSVDGVETWITKFRPFTFPGEVTVSARLSGRRATDLNVMSRRGSIRASVRMHTSERLLWATVPEGETSVCIVLAGRASLRWQKDPQVDLGERDAVIVTGPGRFVISGRPDLALHQVHTGDQRPGVVFVHVRFHRLGGEGR